MSKENNLNVERRLWDGEKWIDVYGWQPKKIESVSNIKPAVYGKKYETINVNPISKAIDNHIDALRMDYDEWVEKILNSVPADWNGYDDVAVEVKTYEYLENGGLIIDVKNIYFNAEAFPEDFRNKFLAKNEAYHREQDDYIEDQEEDDCE